MRTRAPEHCARYVPGWLEGADTLLRWCLDHVDWRSESIHLHGRNVSVPRLIAWFGECGINYRYSGRDHVANGWPAALDALRGALAREHDLRANFALLNLYRDGRDCMGWHRDDEPGMGPLVASISLGATRRLRVRGPLGPQAFDLEHSSLLLLDGGYPHTLTRTRKPVAPRVNLTLRRIA